MALKSYTDYGGDYGQWQDAYLQQEEADRLRMEEELRRQEEDARRLAEEDARRQQEEEARRAAQQPTVDRSQLTPPSPTLGDLMQPPQAHTYDPGAPAPGPQSMPADPPPPALPTGLGMGKLTEGAAPGAGTIQGNVSAPTVTPNNMSPEAFNAAIRDNPQFQAWLQHTRARIGGMSAEEQQRIRGFGVQGALADAGLPTEIPHDFSFNLETGEFERDSFMERNPWVQGAIIAGGIGAGGLLAGAGGAGAAPGAIAPTAAVTPAVVAPTVAAVAPAAAATGGAVLGGALPHIITGLAGITTAYMGQRAQSQSNERASQSQDRATDSSERTLTAQMEFEREQRERDRADAERRWAAEQEMSRRMWDAQEEDRLFQRNIFLEDRAARAAAGSAPRYSGPSGPSEADLRKQRARANLDALLRQGTPGLPNSYVPATQAGPTGRG